MSAVEPSLVLASASVRRLELLRQIGLEPLVQAADIDESRLPGEKVTDCVERLALSKALAAKALLAADSRCTGSARSARSARSVILAADTVVIDPVTGGLLGKPHGRPEALAMLAALSNTTHEVITAVSVIRAAASAQQPWQATVSTQVSFASISASAAEHYWRTGESQGKAGGYAIQGLGAVFVRHLQGSYSNVVGLPLFETAALLRKAGILVSGD